MKKVGRNKLKLDGNIIKDLKEKTKSKNKEPKLALIGNIKIPYATKSGLSKYFKSEGHTFSSGVRIILNDFFKKINKNF